MRVLELQSHDRDALLSALGWAQGANSEDAELIKAICDHIESVEPSVGLMITVPAGVDPSLIIVVTSYDPDAIPVYIRTETAPGAIRASQVINRDEVASTARQVAAHSVILAAIAAFSDGMADLEVLNPLSEDALIILEHLGEVCGQAIKSIKAGALVARPDHT